MRGNPDKTKPFRWKAGQSGNPGGRPKSRHISDALRQALQDGDADDLANILLNLCRNGKQSVQLAAIREVADRSEGRPLQAHKIEAGMSSEDARRLADIAEKLFPKGE